VRKQNFPTELRVALWRAHDRRCIYCTEPFSFNELWVEHIIPKKLAANKKELSLVLREFDLDADFDLDGYGNLLPCCAPCNRKKSGLIFEKKAAHFYLQIAKRKLEKVKQEEQRIDRNQEADNVLTNLSIAFERGLIKKREVEKITSTWIEYSRRITNVVSDHFVITFAANVSELLTNRLLPENVPDNYSDLCDWLEGQLTAKLTVDSKNVFYYPEPSARNGETLSVRLAFARLDLRDLDRFESGWWEVVEVAYMSDIYDSVDEWFRPYD
jgi:hypothetical protein